MILASAFGAAGATLVSTRDAIAAPKEPTDAAREEAAKQRYTEGFKLYGKRRYEEARVAFLQAIMLKPRPAATLMLAQSCLKAGRWLEAAHNYDAYVTEVGGEPEIPAKLRDLVESGRREARSHLGTLRFEVPDGAEVTIDGQKVASVTEPVDVTVGEHTISVTHQNEKKTTTLEVAPLATLDVKPSFIPKPLVPTADTRTRPTLVTKPETPDAPSASTSSFLSPPRTTWPVYVAGAVGLGGLAAAAIFGGLAANSSHAVDVANEALSRLESRPSCTKPSSFENDPQRAAIEDMCLTLRRNQDLASSHAATAGIALIVGLSGTVLATGWFFFAPKSDGRDHPSARLEGSKRSGDSTVVPWIGPGTGGAAFVGRF